MIAQTKKTLCFLLMMLPVNSTGQTVKRLPIIDTHMHARSKPLLDETGNPRPWPCDPKPCVGRSASAEPGEDLLAVTLEIMRRNNVVLGIVTDKKLEMVYEWKARAPELFLTGFQSIHPTDVDIQELEEAYQEGRLDVMGEIATQYSGFAPNDHALEPMFDLAERMDVPVLIHTAGLAAASKQFRLSMGNPLLLEDVLVPHPKLRLYVENAGWPYLEEMVALMYRFPQVYADLSTITWLIPRKTFHKYLLGLIEAGVEKRLMFGSDQMSWPYTIEAAIEAIETAKFLSSAQKRDIFYNNAARFFRLDDDEISKHHKND